MEHVVAAHDRGRPRTEIERAGRSSWRRHAQKIVVLCCWLLAIGCYQGYAWRHELSPLQVMQQMISVIRRESYGPLLFVVLYALRPLVLFPATVLTVGAGVLFGPIVGVISTVVGRNLSALIAYLIGRHFGIGLLTDARTAGLVQRYTERLRTNRFATVLTMRFVFLPYDLVNYLAGLLQIDWKAFLLATALGSLPGTVAVVLAGASRKGDLTRTAGYRSARRRDVRGGFRQQPLDLSPGDATRAARGGSTYLGPADAAHAGQEKLVCEHSTRRL